MSPQAQSAAAADLFARKGTAGPGGSPASSALDPARAASAKSPEQRNGDAKTGAKCSGAPEAAAPGSLHAITLRRGSALAAALARSPIPAEADAGLAEGARPHDAVSPAGVAPAQSTTGSYGPLLALLAVVCFAVGLWYALYSKEPAPQDGATTVPESPAAPLQRPGTAGDAQPAPAVPGSAAEQPSPAPAKTRPVDTAEPGAEAAPGAEGGEAGPQPSFDLIRIEPDGEAVIAGRAAPNSQLILLDNGQPIGKVTADWAGEWAFIPATPLASGDHEFSLVIVTPQGTVAVPGVGKPDKGSFLQSPDLGTGALIKAKAVAGVAPESKAAPPDVKDLSVGRTPSYVVQLSSTTSREGAERERLKLKRSFPRLLADKELEVHEAALDSRGTWYRVRTGNFTEKASARKLCAQLRAERQDCLVIAR